MHKHGTLHQNMKSYKNKQKTFGKTKVKSWCHGKRTNIVYASEEHGGLDPRISAITQLIEKVLWNANKRICPLLLL